MYARLFIYVGRFCFYMYPLSSTGRLFPMRSLRVGWKTKAEPGERLKGEALHVCRGGPAGGQAGGEGGSFFFASHTSTFFFLGLDRALNRGWLSFVAVQVHTYIRHVFW